MLTKHICYIFFVTIIESGIFYEPIIKKVRSGQNIYFGPMDITFKEDGTEEVQKDFKLFEVDEIPGIIKSSRYYPLGPDGERIIILLNNNSLHYPFEELVVCNYTVELPEVSPENAERARCQMLYGSTCEGVKKILPIDGSESKKIVFDSWVWHMGHMKGIPYTKSHPNFTGVDFTVWINGDLSQQIF